MKKYLIRALALTLLALPSAGMAAMTNVLIGFVYQSAIPMILPSSGSFGTNGALTLSTALPSTYANAYMYFPAGAICSGAPAGMYFVQMSSTTVGTVYNNAYTSGKPTIPTKTAFTCGVAPGAYTQVLTSQNLITFQISGGYLGVTGMFKVYELWSYANSASSKTLNTQFGGSNILNFTPTTTTAGEFQQWVGNRGAQNSQVLSAPGVGGFGTTTSANNFLAVDTSINQNVTVNATLASASDYIVLEQMTITGYPQYN